MLENSKEYLITAAVFALVCVAGAALFFVFLCVLFSIRQAKARFRDKETEQEITELIYKQMTGEIKTDQDPAAPIVINTVH